MPVASVGRHRPTPLGHEHVRGLPFLPQEAAQSANFVASEGMDAGCFALRTCRRPSSSYRDHCRSHRHRE